MTQEEWRKANAADLALYEKRQIDLTELRRRYFVRLQQSRRELAEFYKDVRPALRERFLEKIQHDEMWATTEQRGGS